MRFIVPSRKSLNVPIIALIDILAILLIFFIVTTTFKKKKTFLDLSLPVSKQLSLKTDADPRTTLAVSANGDLFLATKPITLNQLAAELQNFKRQSPQEKLELQADKKVSLELLLQVWDALKEAGISIKEVPTQVLLKKENDS